MIWKEMSWCVLEYYLNIDSKWQNHEGVVTQSMSHDQIETHTPAVSRTAKPRF